MKGKKQNHPLREFRLNSNYADVQQLALALAQTKTRGKKFKKFSALIYKIEEDKKVSTAQIEFLISKLKEVIPSVFTEPFDLLKYEILFWKYFPELRKNLAENILKIGKDLDKKENDPLYQ